jgi:hypothetical protein
MPTTAGARVHRQRAAAAAGQRAPHLAVVGVVPLLQAAVGGLDGAVRRAACHLQTEWCGHSGRQQASGRCLAVGVLSGMQTWIHFCWVVSVRISVANSDLPTWACSAV